MKKIAFLAVLIAVIVGIAFGGIALASPAPKPAPTSGPVYMDTFSGNVTVSNNYAIPLSFTYPQARHVSITVGYSGLDSSSDWVSIGMWMMPVGGWDVWDVFGGESMVADWHTCEFDADNFSLQLNDLGVGGSPLTVVYRVTVTYP